MHNPDEYHQLTYQLIQLIRSSLNAQAMLSEFARTVGQAFQADVCTIVAGTMARPNLLSGIWKQQDSADFSIEIVKEFFAHPIVTDILKRTEPLGISDRQQTQYQSSDCWLEKVPIRALLGVATYFQENTNGMIMVGYLQPHQWTSEEHELLEVAGELGAIACYIAQLEKVTKIKTSKESLSSLTKNFSVESSPLFKKWYDLTHQQLEQQRQLNELKDEIITAISDRARNPLASMKLAMEMLSHNQKSLPPELQERYWKILKQEWQRLNDLINNIVTLKKLESHELTFNPEAVALRSLIDELANSFRTQWQEDKRKQLKLVVDEHRLENASQKADAPLILYTDPHHLKNILSELLTNAGNFSQPGTTVSLNITEQLISEVRQVAIAVTNIGRGISASEQSYIFEPFRRGEGVVEQAIAGVGLGLALVKRLVDLLNGKIEVASTPTDDNPDAYVTSFTIALPQFPSQKTS